MPEYVTIYAEDLSTQVQYLSLDQSPGKKPWISIYTYIYIHNAQFSQHISDVRSLAFAKRSHIGPQKRWNTLAVQKGSTNARLNSFRSIESPPPSANGQGGDPKEGKNDGHSLANWISLEQLQIHNLARPPRKIPSAKLCNTFVNPL